MADEQSEAIAAIQSTIKRLEERLRYLDSIFSGQVAEGMSVEELREVIQACRRPV